MRAIPLAFRGERIGLFGGSFDPPHAGHLHVAKLALQRLGLARVWWLVSPGNPLKSRSPAPLAERMAQVRRLTRNRRHVATALEAALQTRFTADTIRALQRRRPGVRFVWIMGADSLTGFTRWRRWREILQAIPVMVAPRPGAGVRALRAKPLQCFSGAGAGAAATLAAQSPPAWRILLAPRRAISSSALRNGVRENI